MDPRAKLARPTTMAVFTLIFLVVIGGLLSVAWRGYRQDHAGTRGTVEVTDCVFTGYAPHGDVYRCGGRFTADGRRFTIPYVTFTNDGRLDSGRRVAVRVTGATATAATGVTESRARLIVTLSGAILFAVVLLAVWRLWLRARRS